LYDFEPTGYCSRYLIIGKSNRCFLVINGTSTADPGFAIGWRGQTMVSTCQNGGLQHGPGAEPLVGVMGQSPLKLKDFCPFSYNKVAKS